MATVEVDGAGFDAMVLKAPGPVLVDFWAEWCGPCKQIAPALEELSEEMAGRLTIAKLNIDENPDLALSYNVRSIPMLALFEGGEVKATRVGTYPKSVLREWLEGALA